MSKKMLVVLCGWMLAEMPPVAAQTRPAEPAAQYDAELAKSLGGDDQGMRSPDSTFGEIGKPALAISCTR